MAGFATTHNRFQSRIPEISKRLPLEFNVALAEGAEVVKEFAKEFCPVGEGRVHLRDAIHVERTYESSTGRVLTWVVAWSREAWYGHLVEWGSVHSSLRRGHTAGWGRRLARDAPESILWTVAPSPFMERAVVAGRSAVIARADRAIKAACDAGSVR